MNKMCYLPWVGLDVSPQSEFRPCCKYEPSIALSLEDYQNSAELKEIKRQFLNGEQPVGCRRCWVDEDAGLPSKRMLDFEYVLGNIPPELTSLKIISFPFGNTCNLACRICSSHNSSKWQSEEKKLKEKIPDITIYNHNKFYKDHSFMDNIKAVIDDVIHVEFPGGEPFLTGLDEHLSFLDVLISNGAEKISLHYMTNTTIYPDQIFWDKWKLFKQVDIQLSIDGLSKHFEYNRWPADWDQCYSNILKYRDYANSQHNIKLSISHCVSIFTVMYLPQFFDWCETNKLPVPYLGLVTRPSYYSITTLPESTKETVIEKLKDSKFIGVVSQMLSKDDSDEFDKCLKYVKMLDKQRQQNFAETFPELYNLLGEKCQTLYQQY